MTAYELNDLMMNWYGMMGQDSDMYLALVSGYLIVAYTIGDRLSFVQVTIINVFFYGLDWNACGYPVLRNECGDGNTG
jgi:hypothetical protein